MPHGRARGASRVRQVQRTMTCWPRSGKASASLPLHNHERGCVARRVREPTNVKCEPIDNPIVTTWRSTPTASCCHVRWVCACCGLCMRASPCEAAREPRRGPHSHTLDCNRLLKRVRLSPTGPRVQGVNSTVCPCEYSVVVVVNPNGQRENGCSPNRSIVAQLETERDVVNKHSNASGHL